MSKKHPTRILVEHDEFRFDITVTNAAEMRAQCGPLLEYLAEKFAPILELREERAFHDARKARRSERAPRIQRVRA